MPFDPDGRAEADAGIFGLEVSAEEAAAVIVPVPFDAATSWGRGARDAPRAILTASHQMDLHDAILGEPYRAGIALLADSEEVVALNERGRQAATAARKGTTARLEEANRIGEQLNEWVTAEVTRWLERDRRVGALGGDHSISYGSMVAHLHRHPDMAVLQIDAHADLRDAYEGFVWSHASVMRNMLDKTSLKKLVQVGLRDVSPGEADLAAKSGRVITHYDAHLAQAGFEGETWSQTVGRIIGDLPDEVYVSFDIDGLEGSLCPNTGTPVPGGLSFQKACALLAAITGSGRRVIGFDLTEICPGPGPYERSWDAVVGAHILYRLCGHALCSK